jgi:prepilin-type N-terminal cleavage/methylation domain-containing protein
MRGRSDLMRRQLTSGFTLVELLIVAALGSLALGAVASVLVGSIRTSITIEQNQQALNELGRIATFIELEIGEAAPDNANNAISTGEPNPCGIAGTEAFTLNLPNPGGISRLIQYYTTGTGQNTILWRCGPPVNNTTNAGNNAGSLDYNAALSNFPLGLSVTISGVEVGTRGESVEYTLESTEPGIDRALASNVRVRSFRVEN